jgi:hypothetical protein
MRGFRRDAVLALNLQMPGMELASEMVIKSAVAKQRVKEIPITLYPDGRDRPPHLRSFRDGWRHLRFMLLCCPTFLFFVPGLLLLLAGLTAIPVTVLAGYGVFTDFYGPNFLYTASLVSLTGAHLVAFGILAKQYAHQVDPVFRDDRVERFVKWWTLERGLLTGLGMLAASACIGVPVLLHWLGTWEVPVPAQWIFAGTLFMLGLETIFATFLISILELKREASRKG